MISPVDQNWGGIVANIPQTAANVTQTNAQTGLINQQAQGLNIANQRAAIGLALYKHVLGDFTGQQAQGVPDETSSGSSSPAAGSDTAGSDQSGTAGQPSARTAQQGGSDQSGEDSVDSGFPDDFNPAEMRQAFWVNPAGSPRSQQMLLEAAMTGDQGLLQYAQQQRNLQVTSDTAESQKRANDFYDVMGTVANAPKGAALQTLERIAPPLADRIEKQYSNDPAEQDAVARAAAMHLAATAHQYTGRPLALGPDGVYRDKVTGMQVPVPVAGMSPADYANLTAKGEALVSVPQSDGTDKQMPLWQADKAPNLAAWAAQQAARGQAQANIAQSPLGRVPSLPPGLHPAVAAAAMNHPALNQPPGAAPSPTAQPSQPPAQTPAQAQYNQQMRTALSDKEYRLQQTPVVSGQSATPAAIAQQKETVQARAQLMQDSQAATSAASQALTYLRAAQIVMQSKGKAPIVGPFGGIIAQASRVFGGHLDATNFQSVAKYLGNAALQNARSTYGARMTQSEVRLQLEELSPSTKMTPDAINDLLAENTRNALYTLQSARRVRPYLMAGNDPQSYAEWNEQYFKQEDIVNASTKQAAAPNRSGSSAPAIPAGAKTATGPNGQKLILLGGRWMPLSSGAR